MREASGGFKRAPVGQSRSDAMNEPKHRQDLDLGPSLGRLYAKENVKEDHATDDVSDALCHRKKDGKVVVIQVRLIVYAGSNTRDIPSHHQQGDAQYPIVPYFIDELHLAGQKGLTQKLRPRQHTIQRFTRFNAHCSAPMLSTPVHISMLRTFCQ